MIIDCAHYRDGRRQSDTPMTLDVAATTCREEGFVWLGLFEPTAAELDEVRQCFGLHELAVKDAETFHLRPKIEQYERSVDLVILRTARYDDAREEVDFGEISIFVSSSFVITVRQGVASELHAARSGSRSTRAAASWGRRRRCGPSSTRLSTATRRWWPSSSGTSSRSRARCSAGEVAPTERIYFLRREVTNFHRAVHPLLAVLAAVERTSPRRRAPALPA